MKLTITTLVIIEGSYIQGIFHSLEEHPGKAYQELVDQVENEYGYDADKDHVPKTPKILHSRQRPSGRDDNPIYLLL